MSKVVKSNSTSVRKSRKSRKSDPNVWKHNSIYSNCKDDFTVEYAVGGQATKVTKTRISCFRSQKQIDSRRGKITEFSRQARQRMMWLCASLNQANFDPRKILFCTLTYPGEYVIHKNKEIKVEDIDGKLYKYHLNHFVTRLKQKYPNQIFGVIRFEWQQRGVGHYLLALFGLKYLCREFVNKTWKQVIGNYAITDVQRARTWKETSEYFSKRVALLSYLNKDADENPNEENENIKNREIGKHWSYINMKLMKQFIKRRIIEMSREQFYAMRRMVFNFLKSVKYRKIYKLDEAGISYQDLTYKMHRWKKTQVKYRRWRQARIALGGSISIFVPNEILRKMLVACGVEGLDFENRLLRETAC